MRIEDLIYSDLREQVTIVIDEIESAGTEKLDTFPSLLQDVFQSFYSLSPQLNNSETLTITARQINAEIMNFIMSSDEYRAIKPLTEGRELPAYEAVHEFAKYMLDKLDNLLNTDSGSNAAEVLDSLERQQEQLLSKILAAIENGDLSAKDSVLNMVETLTGKQQQIERLSEIVSQNIRKNRDVIQSALSSAAEKAQETSDIIKSWGNGDNSPQAIQQNAELLRRVQMSSKLCEIVKYLGRYLEVFDNARKSSFNYGRGDKYDTVYGNDFTRALSCEYASLALPETIPIFIKKVQQKKLKQYRKRERITKGYGDIVVCIDESGSMTGDTIAWAKAVALVLLKYTTLKKRSCAMIRFASRGSTATHIFKEAKYTADDVFAFAESFLNGGTDFETPLKSAVKLIESEEFQNADVVFITDGECGISDKFAESFRNKSVQLKFKVTGIVIDTDATDMSFSLEPFCEKVYRLSELTGDDIAADIIKRKFR